MATKSLLLALVCLSSITILAQGKCVYTIFVKTGWYPKSGTDSSISVEFFDSNRNSYKIDNLTQWGATLLDADHRYFERTQLDVFSGFGDCFDNSICGVNVTSDGSGTHHGWYCEYVEVTTSAAGRSCNNHHFEIEQWLATDAYPYSLTTYRDDCVSPSLTSAKSARLELPH